MFKLSAGFAHRYQRKSQTLGTSPTTKSTVSKSSKPISKSCLQNAKSNSISTESKLPLSSISVKIPIVNGDNVTLSSVSDKNPIGNERSIPSTSKSKNNFNIDSSPKQQNNISKDSLGYQDLIDKFMNEPEECPMVYDISQNKKTSLPYIEVHTSHSQSPLKFLVDTGSSICLVKGSSLSKEPMCDSHTVKFKGINDLGSHAETKGRFILSIFNSPQTEEVSIPFYFHVVSNVNLDYDGIIGTNFLSIHKASILYSDSKLKCEVPTGTTVHFELKTYDQTYVIPARSEMLIECPVTNPEVREGLILCTKLKEYPKLTFSRCLTCVRPNGKIIISVLNTSENQVLLNPIKFTLEPVSCVLEPSTLKHTSSSSLEAVSCFQTTLSDFDRDKRVQKALRCDHLTQEEESSLRSLCSEFSDIFYLEGDILTATKTLQHEIRTTSQTPIHAKTYRFPECHKNEVGKQVKSMLDQGIISPSVSPWSAPIWVVPKKQDASGKPKWRIVIDYRKLNEITIGDAYPIPNITDILDQLGHSKYFSTLDLASSFHQVMMKESDAEKTAFSVPGVSSVPGISGQPGHYQFNRMPFGLRNAPSTFQRLMNVVLSGLQGLHCYTYMDDIVIFGHDLKNHVTNLKLVFEKLREHNLKLQPDKSEFLHKEVQYLGHIITDKGVKPDPKKIECVKKFPVPKNPRDIKSFLGLVGYYRRFIENFSHITKPLTSLLKKDTKFIWLSEQQLAFDTLKEKITTAPILQYPDFTKPFILTTDASNYAVSAILSQGEINKDLPIAYASRTLNKSEGNYSTTEKECLAIIFGTKVFRPYLYGRRFKIVTDHKPLEWLFNFTDPSSKIVRWRLKLEEFEYEVIHKKGKLNCNVDSLSRNPVLAIDPDTPSASETYEKYLKLSQQQNLSYDTIIEEHNDSLLKAKCKMITYPTAIDLDDSIPYCSEIIQLSKFDDNSPDIRTLERELYTFQSTSNDNHVYTHLYLRVHHYDEMMYNDIFNMLRDYRDMISTWYMEEKEFAVSDFKDPFNKLSFNKIYNMLAFLFHNTGIKIHIYHNNILFPTPLEVPHILKDNHDSPSAGHPGISRMYERLKTLYWWKNMRQDIENYVKSCKSCQINKPLRGTNKAPMIITSTATRPTEKLFLDIVGPLPETRIDKFKFILTLQDDLTKYSQAYPMQSCSAQETAQRLVHFISHIGIPRTIVTDQGTNFCSDVFKQLENLFGIKHIYASPYHPQTCGALERSHSTLKEYLRSYIEDNAHTWDLYLNTAMLAYNSNIHSTTGFAPFELLLGYKPYIPKSIDALDSNTYTDYVRALNHRLYYSRQKALQNIQTSKERSKRYYDSHSRPVTYNIGDMVYIRCHHKQNKALSPVWKGPYKVVKVNGNHTVTVQVDRKHIRHHYDEIKPASV